MLGYRVDRQRRALEVVPEEAAIVKLVKNPALRAKMGRSARARVAARYQFQQVVSSYESLYSRMAG